jgi:FAD/FMN-containing dehydrogenase
VLRLFPLPGCTLAALAVLPGYEAVVQLLQRARRGLGPLLSAFEAMWPDYLRLVTGRVGVPSPLPTGDGFAVLVELQGTDEALDAPRFESWLERALEDGVLRDAALAASVADTRAFWALRDAAAEFKPVLGPHASYDVGLPVAAMGDFALRCRAALSERLPGCESVYYGHVGDGNLHLVAWQAGQPLPKEAMDETVYAEVQRLGGSVSAEHGIGTLKKRWLGHARGEAEIALMRRLKAALDPQGLLNPGKVL